MRLIDAAETAEKISKAFGIPMHDLVDVFAEIPTADAQPIVHAHWIELPKALNPNEKPCKCSHCEHVLSFMNNYPKSKYCDNCGARMDGESNDC